MVIRIWKIYYQVLKNTITPLQKAYGFAISIFLF